MPIKECKSLKRIWPQQLLKKSIQILQSLIKNLPGAQLCNANNQNQKQKYWNRSIVAQKQKLKVIVAEAKCFKPRIVTFLFL